MAKSNKIVKNLKKKLTKEEIEELALKEQTVEVIKQAQSESIAADLSSLPHYADASGGTGVGGAALLTEGEAIVGGLSAAQVGLGLLAIGGVAAALGGSGGGGGVGDTTAPAAGTLSFSNLTDTGSDDTPDITQDNTFDLTLTGNEAGSSIEYQVSTDDGATWNTTTANHSGLTDESYQFRAVVTDAAGNSSTTNVISVTVDKTAPAATLIINPEIQLDGNNRNDYSNPANQVTTLMDGNYILTWDGMTNTGGRDVFIQKINIDGSVVSTELQLDGANTIDVHPKIAALIDSGYAVTWWIDGGGYGIFVQKFDSNGNISGSEIQLSGGGYWNLAPQITSTNDGGYVVTWQGSSISTQDDIFVQKFDSSGDTVGSKYELDGQGYQDKNPQITATSDGGFVVAWQGFMVATMTFLFKSLTVTAI
jgi:hypothetical protein